MNDEERGIETGPEQAGDGMGMAPEEIAKSKPRPWIEPGRLGLDVSQKLLLSPDEKAEYDRKMLRVTITWSPETRVMPEFALVVVSDGTGRVLPSETWATSELECALDYVRDTFRMWTGKPESVDRRQVLAELDFGTDDYDVMVVDGHDDAILGITENADGHVAVAYSKRKIIDGLERQGMEFEEALEFSTTTLPGRM